VDENRDETLIRYLADGRISLIRDPEGNEMRLNYTGQRLTSRMDPLNRLTRYEYDAAGHVVSEIDPTGGMTTWTYDRAGRLLTATDPKGFTTINTYRPDGRMGSTRDPLGNVITYDYDAAGNLTTVSLGGHVTTTEYDGQNRIVRITDALGGVAETSYDGAGNPVRHVDPAGRVTILAYDQMHRLVGIRDAANLVTTQNYDADGRLIAVTLPNGAVTRFRHDCRNRLVEVTNALGGVQTFTYDNLDHLISRTDEAGKTTLYSYDRLGRLLEQTDPTGAKEVFTYDNVGRIESYTDQEQRTTSFTYDDPNRRILIVNPQGHATTRAYDIAGNLVAEMDPLGRTTTFEYNALGQLIATFSPGGSVTRREYDEHGNLTAITDPAGQTTRFEYDALGRITRRTDPLGAFDTFAYDPVGNRTEHIDRVGRRRTFSYDELGRLTEEVWWDGNTPVRAISTTHDEVGNRLSVTDPAATLTFGYDLLGRMIRAQSVGPADSPDVMLTYDYDSSDNLVAVKDGAGFEVVSTYDDASRLDSRTWNYGGDVLARLTIGRDLTGRKTVLKRFRSQSAMPVIQTTFEYDQSGRLEHLTHADAANLALVDYLYSYDKAGQLVRSTQNAESMSYVYDPDSQLTTVLRAGTEIETYRYDTNGNRTASSRHGDGYVVGPGNRIMSDGSFDYVYDAAGHTVVQSEIATGKTTEFEYDHRARLILARTLNSEGVVLDEVRYVYDADDRRIAIIVGEEATYTTYDGLTPWIDQTDDKDVTRYLSGEAVDELLARLRPDGVSWYLTDVVGSIRDLADESGAISSHIEYDAFGNLLSHTNPAAGDRFRFTGREFDRETNLYYYRARYYNPNLGRFLSEDPLAFDAGDANLYRYVNNAPLHHKDPTGLQTISEERLAIVPAEIALLGNIVSATETTIFYASALASEAAAAASAGTVATTIWTTTIGSIFVVARPILALFGGLSFLLLPSDTAVDQSYIVENEDGSVTRVLIEQVSENLELRRDDTCFPVSHGPSLRRNMLQSGIDGVPEAVAFPPGLAEAHHIVPKREPPAEPAKEILRLNCVGINEDVNGVFLPSRYGDFFDVQGSPLPETHLLQRRVWHRGTAGNSEPHTQGYAYAGWVNNFFLPFRSLIPTARGAILLQLVHLRGLLRNGIAPWWLFGASGQGNGGDPSD
jgi:RHS repeat-associated protein